MKIQSVAPTGIAQSFEINETFFSTTDQRGVITAGNHVFLRTSGYSLEELIGQPHNLIRHPDIPRCVFRLLWQTAAADQPFIGYVKNQAKSGNHYWVMAIIVPIPSGFLSVRIKPTSSLLPVVEKLYKELLQAEQAALARGQSESNAALEASALLNRELTTLGFSSYTSFSNHCLTLEVQQRDTEAARRHLPLYPAALRPGAEAHIVGLFQQATTAFSRLNFLMENLAPFTAMGEGIRTHMLVVSGIAEDFRLNALNAHVAAHPLGVEGITIGTVAQFLDGHAHVLARNVNSLTTHIIEMTVAVTTIASNISIAKIQLEMLLGFLYEIAGETEAKALALLVRASDLCHAFTTTLDCAVEALTHLQGSIPQMEATRDQLRKDIVYLQVAQISGMTEAARLRNAGGFQTMFKDLRKQIESATAELAQLGMIVERLTELTGKTPAQVSSIYESLSLLGRSMQLARNS